MFNIAFVGHIDHGKSTLIGRLLYDTNSLPEGKLEEIKRTCEELGKKLEFAYICDALEEERKNQMTIETAQTFFKSKREYAIIDAPGHKEFIKNMATGVSQADAAVLIVDVKEGVKEQTKRHAYLLKLLGISDVVVVVNKMDLVNYKKENFEKVKEEILAYLEKIGISPSYIIPISAYEGDNVVKKSEKMSWYKGLTFIEVLDSLEKKRGIFDLRLPIQDVYLENGKTIYVGNVLSGEIKKGEIVKCYPNKEEIKIEKILDGENEVECVSAPKAVGLITDKKLERGFILAKNSEPIITKEISPLVFCLVESIEKGMEYFLRCSTQEIKCKIEEVLEKIDVETLERKKAKELKETEIGRLRIRLEKPIVVEKFNKLKELGRFVILKEGKIIGGGII